MAATPARQAAAGAAAATGAVAAAPALPGDASNFAGGGGGGSSYGITGLTNETDTGAAASVTITYTVPDTVSLAQPNNITADATSPAGATVSFTTPAATDSNPAVTPQVSCNQASGTTFPVGVTTVTCTATDALAVPTSTSVTFTVTVVPVLSLAQPNDITVDATSPRGAKVAFPVPAVSDPANPQPPAAVCAPASGSTFAIGTTTVTCTADDSSAMPPSVTVAFTVTVKGAAAQLADLATTLQDISHGKLLAPAVTAAAAALAAGHPLLAVIDLTQFIVEVAVLQHAGAFTAATAQALTADAARIIAVIGVFG